MQGVGAADGGFCTAGLSAISGLAGVDLSAGCWSWGDWDWARCSAGLWGRGGAAVYFLARLQLACPGASPGPRAAVFGLLTLISFRILQTSTTCTFANCILLTALHTVASNCPLHFQSLSAWGLQRALDESPVLQLSGEIAQLPVPRLLAQRTPLQKGRLKPAERRGLTSASNI